MKHKFKVGDRVENITATDDLLGEKGEISRIDDSSLPYYVKYDNGDNSWEYENDLKLIPNMKHIKDLGEKVAIQCKTQEEWDFVTKELGYEWQFAKWSRYKEKSCIISIKEYCELEYYISKGYTIHQASDFMPSTVNQRIDQLEKELADLKESVRPKKKIEFVKWLNTNSEFEYPLCAPREFESVEILYSCKHYDIMVAKNDGMDKCIYLGHFNDGIK